MKKIGFIIFVIALAVGLAVSSLFSFGRATGKLFNFDIGSGGTSGSGHIASEKRDLSGFNAIEVGGTFQVEIVAQKDFDVEVTGDNNLLPLIKTEVDGGVLRIQRDGRMSPTKPILIRVSAPDINSMEISGAAAVTAGGLKNNRTSVELSGKSDLKIAGQTDNFVVELTGASYLDAENLNAVDATVDTSGASSVLVNATGKLTADASGASTVTYIATPTNLVKSSTGAATISQKN